MTQYIVHLQPQLKLWIGPDFILAGGEGWLDPCLILRVYSQLTTDEKYRA